MPQRSGSVSVHTLLRYDTKPDGLPSTKGELANSAVASGCNARLMRYFSTMSASDSKSRLVWRSEEHTSELQSLMRISYAVFCLKKKKKTQTKKNTAEEH